MSSLSGIDNVVKKYLDEVALSALIARNEKVDKAQVSKLVEMVETVDSLTLQLYIARQVARGEWSRNSGVRIINVIENVRNSLKDEESVKQALRKLIGYFKWFYDSLEASPLSKVMTSLRGQVQNLDQLAKNPKAPAPQGFASLLVRAALDLL